MPAAAFGTGHLLFEDNPSMITGMVLEFAVPAAVVGVMWVSIYQGNSSVALALVVIATVLAPVVIPATLHLLIGTRVEMDTPEMMRDVYKRQGQESSCDYCRYRHICGFDPKIPGYGYRELGKMSREEAVARMRAFQEQGRQREEKRQGEE